MRDVVGLKDAVFIVLGILSAGFGLKGFLVSSHFIDGGVTGISMLPANVFGWPLSVSIPVNNLPFIVAGYRLVGRAFAVKSARLFRWRSLSDGYVTNGNIQAPDKSAHCVPYGNFQ
jgi:uncharacterized membrane-anchored protein YitT (DUF2179 family)